MTKLFAAIAARRWAQALVVTLVCALVYGVNLGEGGLTRSEGHRVGPGWAMLGGDADGSVLVPHLFETTYVRKPPGAPMAIAAGSWALGQNEWGARVSSALASLATALVSMAFAWRWFGLRFGLAAGVAQALAPWFWESGRAAEIEAMHNLGGAMACLGIVNVVVRGRSVVSMLTLAGGLSLALVTKGPASGVAIGGAVAGSLIAGRSLRGLSRPDLWLGGAIAIGVAMGVFAVMAIGAARARDAGETVVAQSPSEFLWGDPLGALALAPTALAMALPMSLALLFPWGPDAREEATQRDESKRAHTVALALAWAWLIGAVGSALIGLSNPRYVLPVATVTAPLVAYVVWGACGGFGDTRRAIARAMLLSGKNTTTPGLLWIPILLVAWGVYVFVVERDVRATSGRDAGFEIAALLTDGGVIHADHAIEARPEVLLYAERENDGVRGRWSVWSQGADLPLAGDWVLLRVDEGSDELARLRAEGAAFGEPVWRGDVHKYTFALYRVE